MSKRIADILAPNSPSIYIYGSCTLGDFKFGWSDIDIIVLTQTQMSSAQADQLVGLRQSMTDTEPDNPLYRCFEGVMLAMHEPEQIVYWGTSGQRMIESYHFDSFCIKELLEYGRLVQGEDVRGIFSMPSYAEIRADVRFHYESIRKYASKTGRSMYSFGWLLDIARCVYTLRTGRIIAKTAAGEWALQEGIFDDPAALEAALKVRREPMKYRERGEVLDYAGKLGESIQRYADVLEAELEKCCGI